MIDVLGLPVVKLSADHQPIGNISMEDAIGLVMSQKAYVLTPYDPRQVLIHTPGDEYEAPAIIVVKNSKSVRGGTITKYKKSYVMKRDHYICAYCGGKAQTVDHVVPRHVCQKTGVQPNRYENTVASCWPCNIKEKGGKILEHTKLKFRKGVELRAPTVAEIAGPFPILQRFYAGECPITVTA